MQLVPVFMTGMGRALPRGEGLLVPTECEIRVGLSRLTPEERARPVKELTVLIQNEVLSLRAA